MDRETKATLDFLKACELRDRAATRYLTVSEATGANSEAAQMAMTAYKTWSHIAASRQKATV